MAGRGVIMQGDTIAVGAFERGLVETPNPGSPFAARRGHGFTVDDDGAAVSLPGCRRLTFHVWSPTEHAVTGSEHHDGRVVGLWPYRQLSADTVTPAFAALTVEPGATPRFLLAYGNRPVYVCRSWQYGDEAGVFATPRLAALPLADAGRHFYAVPVTAVRAGVIERSALIVGNGYAPPVLVTLMVAGEPFGGIEAGEPVALWEPLRLRPGLDSSALWRTVLAAPENGPGFVMQSLRRFVAGGFYGGSLRGTLWFSENGLYDVWATDQFLAPARTLPGERVVAAVSVNDDELLLLTNRRVLFTRAKDGKFEVARVEVLSSTIGCEHPASVVEGARGVYFWGVHAVYRVAGGEVERVTDVDVAMRDAATTRGRIVGAFDAASGLVRFVVPWRGDDGPSALLVYDERRQRTALQCGHVATHIATCGGVTLLAGPSRVGGYNDTKVDVCGLGCAWELGAEGDDAAPLAFRLETHPIDNGSAVRKRLHAAHLHVDAGAAADLFIGVRADGDAECFVLASASERLRLVTASLLRYTSGDAITSCTAASWGLGALGSSATTVRYIGGATAFAGVYFELGVANEVAAAFDLVQFQVFDDVANAWVDLEIVERGVHNADDDVPFASSGVVRWRWPERWAALESIDGKTLPGRGYVVRMRYTGPALTSTLAVGGVTLLDARRVVHLSRNPAGVVRDVMLPVRAEGDSHEVEGHAFAVVVDARTRGPVRLRGVALEAAELTTERAAA